MVCGLGLGWPSHFKVAADQNDRVIKKNKREGLLKNCRPCRLLCCPCRRGRVTCSLQVPVSEGKVDIGAKMGFCEVDEEIARLKRLPESLLTTLKTT